MTVAANGTRPSRGLPREGASLQIGELGSLGARLGSGGAASGVYETSGHRSIVLKQYKPELQPDALALETLIEWRLQLSATDRDRLDTSTAWPRNAVFDGPQLVGVTMPRIPDRFVAKLRVGGVKHRQIMYLLYPEHSRTRLGITIPAPLDRLELARLLGEAFVFFHHHEMIIGDVSMTNELFDAEGGLAIYFIDCDGFRKRGMSGVLPPGNTQGWEDPTSPVGTSLDTDSYKLTLLVHRILAADPRGYPSAVLPSRLQPPLTPQLAQVLATAAAAPAGQRPPAGTLVAALVDAENTLRATSKRRTKQQSAGHTTRRAPQRGRAISGATARPLLTLAAAPSSKGSPAATARNATTRRPVLDLTSPSPHGSVPRTSIWHRGSRSLANIARKFVRLWRSENARAYVIAAIVVVLAIAADSIS